MDPDRSRAKLLTGERVAAWSRCAAFALALWVPQLLHAAEISEAERLYRGGEYSQCIQLCTQAIDDREWDQRWWLLRLKSELATGQYAQAMQTYQLALDRYPESIQLHWIGTEVLRFNDRPHEATELLLLIRQLVAETPFRYRDAANRVALGRALLRAGADARQVLELFYDTAKKENPLAAEPHIASGELALEKNDFAVAAESFQAALRLAPDDPDIHFGLAVANQNNSERANASLTRALELNPRHTASLLFQADNLIDRENYDQAEAVIKQVLEVNPKHPVAWAYRAVMAHLAGDRQQEEAHRMAALSTWTTNPQVDHVIGQKLSQKYRFAEGSSYQRRALAYDPKYRPAKVQLCQDLLRLGQDEEGWSLAAEIFQDDQYNVVAYNLVTLRDGLTKFTTLTNKHLILRMEPREAQIYGQRALDLLERARVTLCEKYGLTLPETIVIEIFPRRQDFAIRTFGLPGGEGFLGVCFGSVVTAISPAAQGGRPSNWEAVLWHEFCHVVTLHKTRNKMPRWLSEGISVYEERQANPAWGQVMNPQYREMILKGEATPVSRLSGAFLNPPSGMHLQFAYYESSMVVQFIIERFGVPALQKILRDLGADVPINEALASHTIPIEKLDEEFAAWLKREADDLAPNVKSWEQPELPPDSGSAALAAWNRANPDNFFGLLAEGAALYAEREFEKATTPLLRAIELYPGYGEADSPYFLLASVYRNLNDTAQEQAMLEKFVQLSADAVDARLRLIDLAAQRQDWKKVRELAEGVLAINPLIPSPHRSLAQAAETLGERSVAIQARRTLLLMDPLDLADQHYHLARLLNDDRQHAEARRHVVLALEQAPRYRAAHQLLLELVETAQTEPPQPVPQAAPSAP